MARGWESKSVELQMEASKSQGNEAGKKTLTAEVAANIRKRETLLLAVTHLREQIEKSRHPRHREMLQSAMADLQKQIEALGEQKSGSPAGSV